MNRFRQKLLGFKDRLQDRKMYSIVLVTIGLIAIWGLYQYKRTMDLRQELDNQYNRAFYEMVGHVHNVEAFMAKALLTSTPAATATTLEEAWRQATLAQTNLGQLPITQPALAQTSKFLTQVGDFVYSMNAQTIYNKPLDDKQYDTLSNIHGYSKGLRDSLNKLAIDLGTGRLRWGELAKKGTPLFQKASRNVALKDFENIDKQFQQYPALIYDGPFSDHVQNIKPKGLPDGKVSVDQARDRVSKFIGADKISRINNTGTLNNGAIPVYSFEVIFKNAPQGVKSTVEVTQQGGQVLWMINSRPSASSKLNINQAKDAGKKFLEAQGYPGMVDTYYLKEDNTATINYAYQQDSVVVYPDLIKVKVALDNGEVLGFESKAYVTSHTVRSTLGPKLTEQQAREVLNKRLQITASKLAIIPTEAKTEIFCYEFKGKLKDIDFLVYVNAENGKEERILMIMNTPNGVLTM